MNRLLSLEYLDKHTEEFIKKGICLQFNKIPMFSELSKIYKKPLIFHSVNPYYSVFARKTAKVLLKIIGLVGKRNCTNIYKSKQVMEISDKFIIPKGEKVVLLTTNMILCYTNILIKNILNKPYTIEYKHSGFPSTQHFAYRLAVQ